MLKLQYFVHLMWRANSLDKTLTLGKTKGKRRRSNRGWDGLITSPTQWTWVWANSGRWWRTGKPGVLQSMGSQRARHDWATEQQPQEKVEHSYTSGGYTNGAAAVENCLATPQKVTQSHHMTQQFHSWVYIWRKWKHLKRYMHPNLYSNIIYNSQDKT